MKMKTMRKVLEESGRMEDIKEYCSQLVCKIPYEQAIGVTMYYDERGNVIDSITSKDIIKGIKIWLKYIDLDMYDMRELKDKHRNVLFLLNRYVEDELNVLMHNFTNTLSHRLLPNEGELEKIRMLSVLVNSIDYILLQPFINEDGTIDYFDVPKGWCKL